MLRKLLRPWHNHFISTEKQLTNVARVVGSRLFSPDPLDNAQRPLDSFGGPSACSTKRLRRRASPSPLLTHALARCLWLGACARTLATRYAQAKR